MSNLILCNSKRANKPFYFDLTDTNIYTIEELCYYINNNIYIITNKIFNEELVNWIKDELDMVELSDKLKSIISKNSNLKDIVVTIFCAADYYKEKDIKQVIDTIDIIEGMPILLRRKIKADNYLKYGNYILASKEYEEILESKDIKELDNSDYGNIVHNLGVVRMNNSSISSAAECFKEAYARNNNKESLLQYLCALKLERKEEEYEKEVINYALKNEDILSIEERFVKLTKEAKTSSKYKQVDRLVNLKNEGRVNEYYEEIDKMIANWKLDYKSKRAMKS